MSEAKKSKEYWSDCGLINFVGGKGWGLDEKGKTLYLGNEADVLHAIETGELPEYLKPTEKQVLSQNLELRKEIVKNDTREFKPRSAVRSRSARTFEHRKANIRQTSKGRKPALH
jgi:hypothetical protein